MKHFKDIREGLLKGQSNTLADGESAAEATLKEWMMQYFVTNTETPRKKYNEKQSFIYFISEKDINKAIDRFCSYDGSVITIDLTKTSKTDVNINIITYNGGSDLPMLKIIDKMQTQIKGPNPDLCDRCHIKIYSADNKVVDVESFIHPDTNISSVGYDRNGTVVCMFKSNKFPGTVRDLCAYYCKFENINIKGWQNCKLWFAEKMVINIFMNTIGKTDTNYELGYPSPNILI